MHLETVVAPLCGWATVGTLIQSCMVLNGLGRVIQQLPFPGPHRIGMNLVYARQAADCLPAFRRCQRNPELSDCRESPPSPNHRSAPPRAWLFAPLTHVSLRSSFWGQARYCLAYEQLGLGWSGGLAQTDKRADGSSGGMGWAPRSIRWVLWGEGRV